MNAYLGSTIKRLGGIPIIIGGTEDHLHIFTSLPRTLALSSFLEKIKKTSSRWIKTKDKAYRNFSWQNGYAAFSVSSSRKESTIRYISLQKYHHNKRSFEEELILFLHEYGIDYDTKFVWD